MTRRRRTTTRKSTALQWTLTLLVVSLTILLMLARMATWISRTGHGH